MAHRGVCPEMACERIRQELEKAGGVKRVAYRVVAEEMGIPWTTARTWHSRETQMSPPPKPRSEAKPKPKRISKLNPTDKEVVVSEEFRAAFEAMRGAIQNAKAGNWKATSQQAALHYLDILVDVVTVK